MNFVNLSFSSGFTNYSQICSLSISCLYILFVLTSLFAYNVGANTLEGCIVRKEVVWVIKEMFGLFGSAQLKWWTMIITMDFPWRPKGLAKYDSRYLGHVWAYFTLTRTFRNRYYSYSQGSERLGAKIIHLDISGSFLGSRYPAQDLSCFILFGIDHDTIESYYIRVLKMGKQKLQSHRISM